MTRRRKKLRKRGDIGQPKVPGPIALAALQATGAGTHGKSRKAKRRSDKIRIQKGDFE